MKKTIAYSTVTWIACLSILSVADAKETRRIAVVCASGSIAYEHAAHEFIKYAEKISPQYRYVMLDDKRFKAVDYSNAVLIGPPGGNSAVATLVKEGLFQMPQEISGNDGFILRSVTTASTEYLVLTGNAPLSTHYAVYDYLERFGNCGFFLDGDYIPEGEELPLKDIDVIEVPRIKYRTFPACALYWAIKYDNVDWKEAEWKNLLDFLVKNKMNITSWLNYWYLPFTGMATKKTWPNLDIYTPTSNYQGGFVRGWIWPPEYCDTLYRSVLNYGRMIGLRFFYSIDFIVPPQYEAAHPEVTYLRKGPYGHSYINPFDPHCKTELKRYLQNFIALYGTDSLFFYGGYSEEIALIAPTQEEISAINEQTSKVRDEIIKELGPNVQLYGGGAWMSGEGRSLSAFMGFGGDDHLHGDIPELLKRVRREGSGNGVSDFIVTSEFLHPNYIWWQLATKLAWDPEGIDNLEHFIEGYVRRRYGHEHFKTMLKVTNMLVDAVWSQSDVRLADDSIMPIRNSPFYQYPYRGFGATNTFPVVDDSYERAAPAHYAHNKRTISKLKSVITKALEISESLSENPFYRKDVFDMIRTYLSLVSNQAFLDTYWAFKEDDLKVFVQRRQRLEEILTDIEILLSARDDFSLKSWIDEIISAPGINPKAEEMLRQGNITADYPNRDAFEIMHHYYIPRVRLHLDLMERKLLKSGASNTITIKEVTDYWKANGYDDYLDKTRVNKFLTVALDVPDKFHFKGSETEAVSQIFEKWKTVNIIIPYLEGKAHCIIRGKDIIVTASGQDSDNFSRIYAADGSGLDLETGLVHTSDHLMQHWHSGSQSGGGADRDPGTEEGAAWIRFDFNNIYKIGRLWVWNLNWSAATDRGLRNVSIEYSTTGGDKTSEWTKLGDFVFSKAPGTNGYAGFKAADFGDVRAKSVVITAHSADGNWGTSNLYGLSEVRFYGEPVTSE